MGSPVLFIEIVQNGKFQFTEKAKSFLRKYKDKRISVISICGPQRSGKSFLANAILKQMRGFSVGHSVQACTKGIWLWSEPLFLDEDTLLLVLDCEGLYSSGNYLIYLFNHLFQINLIQRLQTIKL